MTLVAIYTRVEGRARAGVWPRDFFIFFFASLYFGFLSGQTRLSATCILSLDYLASHPWMCTTLLVFGNFLNLKKTRRGLLYQVQL